MAENETAGTPGSGATVPEKDPYLGEFVPEAETVELIKKLYPYFRVEEGRDDFVRFGNFYAHPEARAALSLDMAEAMLQQQNVEDPQEVRKKLRDDTLGLMAGGYEIQEADHPEWAEFGCWEEYEADPCPEEPDAPKVRIVIRRYWEEGNDGPYPTLVMIPGGGLLFNDPRGFCSAIMSKYLRCQIVGIQFRGTSEAQYPAAVNDLHAAYQWMIDNAEELKIDLDRIVIYGTSSGGHLASVLPFRLKRYNWLGAPKPRGVIVDDGFFDDRETTRSMRLFSRAWCGFNNRAANMLYMGPNFSSGFIGPEAYANHATVEECKGLPPYFIYAGQDCPGCDPAMQFAMKLNEAGVFCSFFMCGGVTHVRPEQREQRPMLFLGDGVMDEYEPLTTPDTVAQIENFVVNGIVDCFENDLRRENPNQA